MPSEARKRELKEQYKAMRPEMGVFVFRCVPTGKNYVGWTHDLKGTLNSLRFQLELGSCREKALQEAWRVHGGAAFCVDVLEKLPYDKDDETKTDYSDRPMEDQRIKTMTVETFGVEYPEPDKM